MTYACSLCRNHFHSIFNDSTIQEELKSISTQEDASLFVWKVHNCVTANNMPAWSMFPQDMHLKTADFVVPHTPTQLKIKALTKAQRTSVLKAVYERWRIEDGLDSAQVSNDACPATSEKVVRMDLWVMSKCPFCKIALKKLRPLLKCDVTCSKDDGAVKGGLDFRMHYVGTIGNKTEGRKLKSLHGPGEVVGDKLVLCAMKHYPRHYEYLDFAECMERNQTAIPHNGKPCAKEVGFNYTLLESCAHEHGDRMLRKNFELTLSNKIEWTPDLYLSINGIRHQMTNPANVSEISASICELLANATAVVPDSKVVQKASMGALGDGDVALAEDDEEGESLMEVSAEAERAPREQREAPSFLSGVLVGVVSTALAVGAASEVNRRRSSAVDRHHTYTEL